MASVSRQTRLAWAYFPLLQEYKYWKMVAKTSGQLVSMLNSTSLWKIYPYSDGNEINNLWNELTNEK